MNSHTTKRRPSHNKSTLPLFKMFTEVNFLLLHTISYFFYGHSKNNEKSKKKFDESFELIKCRGSALCVTMEKIIYTVDTAKKDLFCSVLT